MARDHDVLLEAPWRTGRCSSRSLGLLGEANPTGRSDSARPACRWPALLIRSALVSGRHTHHLALDKDAPLGRPIQRESPIRPSASRGPALLERSDLISGRHNGTLRALGASRHVPLHRRASQAQMTNGLSSSLDERRGSRVNRIARSNDACSTLAPRIGGIPKGGQIVLQKPDISPATDRSKGAPLMIMKSLGKFSVFERWSTCRLPPFTLSEIERDLSYAS